LSTIAFGDGGPTKIFIFKKIRSEYNQIIV